MSDIVPQPPEPPTSRQLVRSTIVAAGVALVILVTAVWPAEYGVDPTGIGRILGLTQMGEIKVSLAKEAAGREAPLVASGAAPTPTAAPTSSAEAALSAPSAAPTTTTPRNEVRITLAPNEGKEVKLVMRKGARASYIWSADGPLNFDTHGETADGAPSSYYSYGKGSGKRLDQGDIIAAFDGLHGWFWRNRTRSDVTLTLKTVGDYQDVKESGTIAPTKPLDPPPSNHGHQH